MIVADTSYIVEAILHDSALLDDEPIVAPDLALYETMNAIWKHETLILVLENASMYIDVFLKLIGHTAGD